MVGSIKTFKYTTESGAVFAYNADESNTEGLIGGAAAVDPDFVAADENSVIYTIPKNVRPRKALFVTADRLRRKEIIVPTTELRDAYATRDFTVANQFITDTMDGVSVQFAFRKLIGEEVTIPLANDTGIIDGDAT